MPEERPQTFSAALINDLVQAAAKGDEEFERKMDEVYDPSIMALTPWLRRTGWTRTFKKKDMKVLHELKVKPSNFEPGLLMV